MHRIRIKFNSKANRTCKSRSFKDAKRLTFFIAASALK